jgi:hypothetical protein
MVCMALGVPLSAKLGHLFNVLADIPYTVFSIHYILVCYNFQ